MRTYKYLIIGGGMVADGAARGIRELDGEGTIGILSADVDPPYTRPALTKKLWTDPSFGWSQVPLGTQPETGADLDLETEVTSIDREKHQVRTAEGEDVGYERLLLATGVHPRQLDDAQDDAVIYFRSADDYHRVRRLATPGRRFVIVGGGYIGSELAAALIGQGCEVTLVFPEETLGGSMFPSEIASGYQRLFTDAGVQLLPGRQASVIGRDGQATIVTLDDGNALRADAVIAGLGTVPATELAEAAGLEVDDGIVVDAHLKTSDEAVWAAGDVASYPDAILGRTRVEHVDSARKMGRAVGRSMAGDPEPYAYTPYFYSVVFGVGWQAVGTLDPSLEVLATETGDGEPVAVYLDSTGAPVGVLLWQAEGRLDAARTLLARRPTDRDEIARSIR
ncbi:Putidaredoxin reductase [Acidipropionibacterium virtanenii]|uniref:Putidaredoxin reductase n=2 Tax=Acidipropionibacterium virtanenii TaxID=2057246 RepID=A0A344UR13_9ACTN|nr:NAD(P)/FAD-dependent oxidoreductase [Acidipropionibacterium virtanenii]AXE37711.1 Putidaredoxin reductase [Acidipropionibacterium virtanenii]